MRVVTGIIIGMLMALNAHAGFIKQDWANEGDRLVSIDTSTNLAWLSPSINLGASWSEVRADLDNDPLYEGFRFATIPEYLALLGPQGLNFFASPAFDNPEETSRFLNHFGLDSIALGESLNLILGQPQRGLSGAPEDEDRDFVYTSEILFDNNTMFFASLLDTRYLFPNRSSPSLSYLLVRELPDPPFSNVPEPTPFMLMLMGLFATVASQVTRSRNRSANLA